MYHFGYGSNLNQDFLRQYVPSAEFVMKAYLPNYEVQFRFWSKRRPTFPRSFSASLTTGFDEGYSGDRYPVRHRGLADLGPPEDVGRAGETGVGVGEPNWIW